MNQLPEQTALVVLAGGRGSRMGGELKAALRYRGEPLLARILVAAWESGIGLTQTVVVGDELLLPPLLGDLEAAPAIAWCREEPAYGGPVAALQSALAVLYQPWLVLLAGDLPAPESGLSALLSGQRERDGAILVDAEEFEQNLFALYRTEAVRAALLRSQHQQDPRSGKAASMRSMIASLELARIAVPNRATADIDEWADADRWGIEKGTR